MFFLFFFFWKLVFYLEFEKYKGFYSRQKFCFVFTLCVIQGSSLANYTPKSGFSYEEFQLGVTKSSIPVSSPDKADSKEIQTDQMIREETEKPVLFSKGANSDILF